MANPKIDELRALSVDELETKLRESKEELFNFFSCSSYVHNVFL